ncbi:MAG: hypothetical protein VXY77_04465 [Pseudomonadota bacterium]|nr:hypothetical protein [Pseudomonadota bacterium]
MDHTVTIFQKIWPQVVLIEASHNQSTTQHLKQIAKSLLCMSCTPKGACNQCKSCHLFDCQSHPDYMPCPVDIENPSVKIKTEHIRLLIQKSQSTPVIHQHQVIIIPQAQSLTIEASNRLLKSLESPKDKLFFILQAPTKQQVLKTILSRCIIYTVHTNPQRKADICSDQDIIQEFYAQQYTAEQLTSMYQTHSYIAEHTKSMLASPLSFIEGLSNMPQHLVITALKTYFWQQLHQAQNISTDLSMASALFPSIPMIQAPHRLTYILDIIQETQRILSTGITATASYLLDSMMIRISNACTRNNEPVLNV